MLIQKLGLVNKDSSGISAAQDTDDQRLKVSVNKTALTSKEGKDVLF